MTHRLSIISGAAIVALFLPMLAFAQGTDLAGLNTVLEGLSGIVATLVPIAFAAILLFFFWGLAKYMFGDAEDKEKGKNLMIWGVIALFVAASIWGLVAFVGDIFGVDQGDNIENPFVERNPGSAI